ncbi:hypothetical protein GCM10007205_22960 [Oxalicibacterium flavum]|uniref:diguanylate cyclase n=1 Tax=Oxalicibacterium flavum TaxID=179467 RepID=A0A8J2XYG7_9BURK|nr:GGDEF domain-containing protein [Oxalicibacterium flavum]GGC13457.1 hypothetical protein GCM10007205_22960 [Oxalicibacterium flavum]
MQRTGEQDDEGAPTESATEADDEAAPSPFPPGFPAASPSTPPERRQSVLSSLADQQAARLSRLTLTGLFSALYLATLGIFHLLGRLELRVLQTAAILTLCAYIVFYGLFASGLNLRSRARNLRMPMAVSAIGIMLFVVYLEPAAQMAFAPFFLLTMAFVMHRMSSRTMFRLALSVMLFHALVIAAHYRQYADLDLFKLEAMQFLALALTLPGFVMLADRVQRLHGALYRANRKIRDIEADAQRDTLLGCYNRRYIVAALEQQKRLAEQSGEPLCLAVLDLDHFKLINDDAGHLVGDEVLCKFARIALRNIQPTDIFGRYGGEEFLLVLPRTTLEVALPVVEGIRRQIERFDWGVSLRHRVTVSIGLAQHVRGESVLDLFSRTDAAMYNAKQAGRNRVVVDQSTE